MNVKRYFVKDMQEAMEKIRKELGPDAIVLSNKRVRKKGLLGIFSPKVLEVMVAYDSQPAKPLSPFERALGQAAAEGIVGRDESAAPREESARKTAATLMQVAAQYKNGQGLTAAAPAFPSAAAGMPGIAPVAEPSQGAANVGSVTAPAIKPFQPPPAFPSSTAAPAVEQKEDALPVNEDRLNERLEDLSNMLEGITERISAIQHEPYPAPVRELNHKLLDQEVNSDLARDLADQTAKLIEKTDMPAPQVMKELMLQVLGEPAPLRIKPFKRAVVMMLGPTGVGKTTSLIKLAVYYQIKHDLKVGLINTDTFRVAANEQLKIYADILGAPLSVVYAPDEIKAALEQHEDKDLVFIDTAGKKPSDEKHKKEVQSYIEQSGVDEVFLVMSGSTGMKACQTIIENYDFIKDYKLLITKMDEAVTKGIILNVCSAAGRPLSYIAMGQDVPNDIALADVESIAAGMLE